MTACLLVGHRNKLVVPVKSSFFQVQMKGDAPLCSCAGATMAAWSVGCPCLLRMVWHQCSVLTNTKCWQRINSLQCEMLRAICCWSAKAGCRVPWQDTATWFCVLSCWIGTSPKPFSRNIEDLSSAVAEWDIFSAGINRLSFPYPFVGKERGPGPRGLIFSLLSTFLRNEAFLCP